jgi:hypothetical protein
MMNKEVVVGAVFQVMVYTLVICAFALLTGLFIREKILFLAGCSAFMTLKEIRNFWKDLHSKE